MDINITFPDKSKKKYNKGVTGLEIANSISEGLGRAAIAITIDGTTTDLSKKINKDAKIEILTFKDAQGRAVYWHSAAHLLAHAVKRLFPKALPTIGPDLEEGFYYDFDNLSLSEEDIPKLEAEMKKIAKENFEPVRIEYKSKDDAKKAFKHNKYKVEMIADHEEGSSAYEQGDFIDLCRGPHVSRTALFKAVKITKLAAAYWRGDQKNKQLTRVYGIAFPDKKLMKEYLFRIEEAEKRNHRKIGRELGLFSFHEEAPGMPFFLPKGMVVWNELMKYWREEHDKENYLEIKTPIMMTKNLWVTSGHWENYRENMYTTNIDKMDYAIKPMNCPGGMLVYKEKLHSYRELPLKMGEIGLVHRHELSGVLSGLFRVRCFHQDDAHIFMTEEQITDEVLGVLNLAEKFYKTFGLNYHLELSTRPDKSIGSDAQWKKATDGLKKALDKKNKEYQINEGDGAFYGPKIDIHVKDALGRSWQCGTIQLDMALPERFDLSYLGEDGKKHRPVMVHRVVYGSIERFFGIITEHFAGKFPLWLSPVQVKLLPIADRHAAFCEEVAEKMKSFGIRTEINFDAQTLNKKIREAQMEKVNYILVVGDKEVEAKAVNIRTRDEKVHGTKKVDAFIKELLNEIQERKLE